MDERQTFDTVQLSMKKKSKKVEHKLKTVSKFEFEEAPLQTQRYAEKQDGSFQRKKAKDAKGGQGGNYRNLLRGKCEFAAFI